MSVNPRRVIFDLLGVAAACIMGKMDFIWVLSIYSVTIIRAQLSGSSNR